jgi:hypothetical protein
MEAGNQRLAVLGATVLAAAVAGGCSSPRSLVQLDMDVQSTDTAALSTDLSKARLHIDIKQEQRTVHTVDRPFDELTSVPRASGDNLKIGIFLDADVSGSVTVSVSVIDQFNCPIGTADDISVMVKSGAATPTQNIVISVSVSSCPSGSTDGGAPSPDGDDTAETNPTGPDAGSTDDTGTGNTDDVSAGDAGDNDSAAVDAYCPPETGPEVESPPTCKEFCDLAAKNCSMYYPDPDQCLAFCQNWAPGERVTATQPLVPGNTIACRLQFLHGTVPSMQGLTCPSASPESAICHD